MVNLAIDDDNHHSICQNCHHEDVHHAMIENGYYSCTICSKLCSGKYYQEEPSE